MEKIKNFNQKMDNNKFLKLSGIDLLSLYQKATGIDIGIFENGTNLIDFKHHDELLFVLLKLKVNEIEDALLKIESIPNDNRNNVLKKFAIYILTLIDIMFSKTRGKEVKIEFIHKTLEHIEQNLPCVENQLNWGASFPKFIISELRFYAVYGLYIELKPVFNYSSRCNIAWLLNNEDLDREFINNVEYLMLYPYHRTDIRRNVIVFNLFKVHAKNKRYAEAYNLMSEFDSALFRVYALNYWTGILSDSNQLSERSKLIDEITAEISNSEFLEDKSKMLIDLASNIYNQDKKEEAMVIIRDVVEFLEKIEGYYDREVIYERLVKFYAAIHEFDKAIDYINIMRFESFRDHAIKAFIYNLCKIGLVDRAKDFFIIQFSTIDEIAAAEITCIIAKAYAEANQMEMAVAKLNSIDSLPMPEKIVGFVELAHIALLKGNIDDVNSLLSEALSLVVNTEHFDLDCSISVLDEISPILYRMDRIDLLMITMIQLLQDKNKIKSYSHE